jgi:hypothetical protein
MRRGAMSKLTAIGVLIVALAAFAFSTSTRSADAAGPPTFISVTASATCGGAISASALVRDAQALPFAGAVVSFSSSTGGVGSGVTGANGIAVATLTMPVATTGTVSVSASVAGGPSGSAVVGVNCAPGVCAYGVNCAYPGYPYGGAPYNCTLNAVYIGYVGGCPNVPVAPYVNGCYAYNCVAPGYYNTTPYNLSPCYGVCYGSAPAKINIAANPGVLTCGGASSITANITDTFGVPVANGTAVSYSTSLGTIGASAVTGGGNAVSTLNTAAGTSGVALITVKAGNASATTTIQVNCATPAQQTVVVYQPGAAQTAPQVIYRPQPQGPAPRPQVVVQAPAGAPPFAPPRTGSAGLLDQIIPSDDAANAALIDAFEHQTDAITDASAVDSTDALTVDPNVDASMSDIDAQPLDFDASLIDGNQLGDTDANASLALDTASQYEHAAGDFGLS